MADIYKGPARPPATRVHSPECHLWHPECARVRVNAMVKALERLEERYRTEEWERMPGEPQECGWCHRPTVEQHSDTCPFIVLDQYMLRGVWKGEEGDGESK
jgi:hypothetical protein